MQNLASSPPPLPSPEEGSGFADFVRTGIAYRLFATFKDRFFKPKIKGIPVYPVQPPVEEFGEDMTMDGSQAEQECSPDVDPDEYLSKLTVKELDVLIRSLEAARHVGPKDIAYPPNLFRTALDKIAPPRVSDIVPIKLITASWPSNRIPIHPAVRQVEWRLRISLAPDPSETIERWLSWGHTEYAQGRWQSLGATDTFLPWLARLRDLAAGCHVDPSATLGSLWAKISEVAIPNPQLEVEPPFLRARELSVYAAAWGFPSAKVNRKGPLHTIYTGRNPDPRHATELASEEAAVGLPGFVMQTMPHVMQQGIPPYGSDAEARKALGTAVTDCIDFFITSFYSGQNRPSMAKLAQEILKQHPDFVSEKPTPEARERSAANRLYLLSIGIVGGVSPEHILALDSFLCAKQKIVRAFEAIPNPKPPINVVRFAGPSCMPATVVAQFTQLQVDAHALEEKKTANPLSRSLLRLHFKALEPYFSFLAAPTESGGLGIPEDELKLELVAVRKYLLSYADFFARQNPERTLPNALFDIARKLLQNDSPFARNVPELTPLLDSVFERKVGCHEVIDPAHRWELTRKCARTEIALQYRLNPKRCLDVFSGMPREVVTLAHDPHLPAVIDERLEACARQLPVYGQRGDTRRALQQESLCLAKMLLLLPRRSVSFSDWTLENIWTESGGIVNATFGNQKHWRLNGPLSKEVSDALLLWILEARHLIPGHNHTNAVFLDHLGKKTNATSMNVAIKRITSAMFGFSMSWVQFRAVAIRYQEACGFSFDVISKSAGIKRTELVLKYFPETSAAADERAKGGRFRMLRNR